LQTSIQQAIGRFTSDEANTNLGSVAQALTVTDPNQEYVSYFYVSDLLDNILQGIDSSMDEIIENLRDPPAKYTAAGDDYDFVWDECELTRKQNLFEDFKISYQNFRLVLGPIELTQLDRSGATRYVNIGDMPISIKYFIEFLTDKLASKEENSYPLTRFLNDFLNSLVRTFLNDDTCWNIPVTQRSNLNQSAVSSYKTRYLSMGGYSDYEDEIVNYIKYSLGRWHSPVGSATDLMYDGRLKIADVSNSGDMPLLRVSGSPRTPDGGVPADATETEVNYMVYYIARSQPAEYMKGNREFDESRGIFHYALAKDRGIIKKIALKKTSTPGLAEVRFEQSGFDGLKQLLVKYDVNITTYLNVKTFPGNYIFVDPRSFDPTSNLVPCDDGNLTEYGIGGYYIIVSAQHTIAAGEAVTKIAARWVNKIGHDPDDEEHTACGSVVMSDTEDDNGGESTNCATERAIRADESGGLGGTKRKGISISSTVGLEQWAL